MPTPQSSRTTASLRLVSPMILRSLASMGKREWRTRAAADKGPPPRDAALLRGLVPADRLPTPRVPGMPSRAPSTANLERRTPRLPLDPCAGPQPSKLRADSFHPLALPQALVHRAGRLCYSEGARRHGGAPAVRWPASPASCRVCAHARMDGHTRTRTLGSADAHTHACAHTRPGLGHVSADKPTDVVVKQGILLDAVHQRH